MIGPITTRNNTFAQSITKEEINKLPLTEYSGPKRIVQTQAELTEALKELKREKILGFDTETRPSFRKDDYYLPSLLQLCTKKEVFLIQLNKIPDRTGIAELFGDHNIIKVGVAIRDDLTGLMKLFPFAPENFIELADLARLAEINNTGLRSLCAIMMGKRISKSAQVTNWAKDELTPKQIIYAATDAWISREIYLIFRKHGVTRKHSRAISKGPTLSLQLQRKIERLGVQKLKYHLLFCNGSQCAKCISVEKGNESLRYLKRRLREMDFEKQGGIYLTSVQCLDVCQKGPIMVVYPDGVWYFGCTPEVIERILQNHLLNGRVVKENTLAINRLK
jgi:(2Fe-2S) ferredoxin